MSRFLFLFIYISNIFAISSFEPSHTITSDLRFSNLYQDGMVLQREPYNATLWGYGIIPNETKADIKCSLNDKLLNPSSRFTQIDGKIWIMDVQAMKGGTSCNISIPVGNESLTLTKVLFGDLWFCGGQSNMVFGMNSVYNATQEMEEAKKYKQIRFTRVVRESSEAVDDHMDINLVHDWVDPSSSNLGEMSAVCFLYAKYIYDQIKIPLGLIDSCVGGTKIESWSNQKMLDSCEIEHEQLDCKGPDFINCNTRLYNKMVHPLTRTTLKGFLWYQGESNTAWNENKYNCSFPTLINGWRQEFSSNSNTNKSAPFGFVQLSTIKYGNMGLGMSKIRWHQTADRAIVPNSVLQNVFMAIAIDTYDEPNGIHPRYKQIVGQRLTIAGMNVAYGNSSFPTNGPHPSDLNLGQGPTISLEYNQKIRYNQTEISGFYFCCLDDFDQCDHFARNWVEIEKENVEVNKDNATFDTIIIYVGKIPACQRQDYYRVPHLAYLWRETPIKGYLAAPIYGMDKFNLPAAPWKVVVL